MNFVSFIIVLIAICWNDCDCGDSKPPKPATGATSDSLSKLDEMRPDALHVSPSAKLEHSQSFRSALKSSNASPRLEKSVSFKKSPERQDAPTIKYENTIFWMNKKEFSKNIVEKCKIFGSDARKIKFLQCWVDVMQNNYLMFEKIFKYKLVFERSDIILAQSEVSEERPILFPDTGTIKKLQKQKDSLNEKLEELFNELEPAYLLNEELYNMMKNNHCAEISKNQLNKMNKESGLVQNAYSEFEKKFEDFPIESYIKPLKNIRRTMIDYESAKIEIEEADAALTKNVAELEKHYPKLLNALDSAIEINWKKPQKAIKKFHALIKQVLKIDKVPALIKSFKNFFFEWKFFKTTSK